MTTRQLPLSRLGQLVPPLVEAQALVALVSVTADAPWAAKAAWDIARIAAREGRRVALVDLKLDEPSLHQTVGLDLGDGIVDAFEYGLSLAKAAREMHGVFFISAGSDTANAGDLYGHPRWRKLQAGFRSEGALLLLFMSPAALARLVETTPPDGVLLLAPEGVEPATVPGAEPVLGVVRDRWIPSRASQPDVVFIPTASPARRRGTRAALATLGLAAAAVGGWALFAGAREPAPVAIDLPAPPPAPAPDASASALAHGDTLRWAIQVAAYGTRENAVSHAERLMREAGVAASVLEAPQDDGAPVWYRVVVGSYSTREAAAAGRDTLWQRGVAARGIGTLLPRMGTP